MSEGIAVVIVNYGASDLILQSLPAMRAELGDLGRSHVFIVDNDSPDGDGAALERGLEAGGYGDLVTFLPAPVNGGFAAGNNIAFRAIRELSWQPEAVLLFNPDAEVRPGAIHEMLRVMRAHPRAGFVGPRLENPDGSTWVGAFNFPSMPGEVFGALGLNVLARRFPPVIADSDVPVRCDWVTGTAALIRWQCFAELGDMDEDYFLYYEEVDYMLQGARHGWESWHAPQALVGHVGGATTGVQNKEVRQGPMPAYWFQSWARYFSKNHGAGYTRLTAFGRLAGLILGDAQRKLRGRHSPRPRHYYRDFLTRAALARLSPPPRAAGVVPHLKTTTESSMSFVSDEYRQAEEEMGIPPVATRGRTNENPKGIGFWALVAEDFRTHERKIFEQGFWALFWHRFGNWRMDQPKIIRAPSTLLYRIMFKLTEILSGISLWYPTKIGRRVRIWHHSGMVLGARAIGDDVQIRQNTTFGVGQTGKNDQLPIICAGADIGAGACIAGAVVVGRDAKIGGNALVLTDVPEGAVVMGNPAQIVAGGKAPARPKPAAPAPAPVPQTTPVPAPAAKVPAAPPAETVPMVAQTIDLGRIALLGSANLDYLAMTLRARGEAYGVGIETHVPDFGTAPMELIKDREESALQQAMQGELSATLIAERAEDVLGEGVKAPLTIPAEELDAYVDSAMTPFLRMVEGAAAKLKGPVLVMSLAAFQASPLGLSDRREQRGRTAMIARANEKLAEAVKALPDVHVLDTEEMLAEVGRAAAAPGEYWHMGRIPFGERFNEEIARRVTGALLAIRGKTARILVLDLDNTLWGGVLGEDGIEGVKLGGAYPGSAYRAFQEAIRALTDRGIVLAVASKNDEDLALKMIAEHPEMVIRPDDLVEHRINWDEKALNMQDMLAEVGLGTGSCMFIDDNPVEREKVRKTLPEAIVPEFPDAPEKLVDWLLANPFLEALELTASDFKRQKQYKVRARVNAAKRTVENIEDFYRDLGMQLTFEPFGPMNQQRALQLFVKTNQFNTTTRRHDAQAVRAMLEAGGELYAVGYADKQSDYELMGVILLRDNDQMAAAYPDDSAVQGALRDGALWVDSFLLSCRILGRTVEQSILAWATERAAAKGASALIGQIIETPRNSPVRKVFEKSGFTATGDGIWLRDLETEGPVATPDWFTLGTSPQDPGKPQLSDLPAAKAEPETDPVPAEKAPPAVNGHANGHATPALSDDRGQALGTVFRTLFRLPDGTDLSSASMDTVEAWDSLNHLKLAMEVERSLGIRIPGERIGEIRSYRDLEEAVLDYA